MGRDLAMGLAFIRHVGAVAPRVGRAVGESAPRLKAAGAPVDSTAMHGSNALVKANMLPWLVARNQFDLL